MKKETKKERDTDSSIRSERNRTEYKAGCIRDHEHCKDRGTDDDRGSGRTGGVGRTVQAEHEKGGE